MSDNIIRYGANVRVTKSHLKHLLKYMLCQGFFITIQHDFSYLYITSLAFISSC